MAKSKLGGKRASQTAQSTTNDTFQGRPPQTIGVFDDNYATTLRQQYEDNYDPDVVSALKIYTSKATNANGFSASQELNYALDNDLKFDPKTTQGQNLRHMDRYMHDAMHDVGIKTTLTRAAHDDVLKSLGINDYTKLNQKQLQSKLIGTEYVSKAYTSYSYDESKNPFLTGPQSGGREVIIKATTNPKTKMLFGAKAQAETVIDRGTKHRITNVYYSGKNATPRTGGTKPVVVIEVEML